MRTGDRPLRVVSYNVHRGDDDRTALARVVAALRPDLVCLQEAPSWRGARRRRRRLAATWGMVVVGSSARNVVVATPATAANVTTVRRRRVWRPVLRRRLSFVATQLPGGLVEVTVGAVSVCVCHLGLSVPGRRHEAAQVLAFCRPRERAVLVVGDLNEELTATGIGGVLAAGGLEPIENASGRPAVAHGPTFPSRAPARRIDAALVSSTAAARCRRLPLLDVTDLAAADLVAASDHLPLVVEVSA